MCDTFVHLWLTGGAKGSHLQLSGRHGQVRDRKDTARFVDRSDRPKLLRRSVGKSGALGLILRVPSTPNIAACIGRSLEHVFS